MSTRLIEIQRRFRELGRIRMGTKTDAGYPTSLDTWRLTSPDQDLLEHAAKLWGGIPAEWTDARTKGRAWELVTETSELPVMVPPQNLSDRQYWELWSGGGCERRCDGRIEFLSDQPCLCRAEGEQVCKITTHLLVMLLDLPDIGVWRLTSRGFAAAEELPGTIDLLNRMYLEGEWPQAILAVEHRSAIREGTTHQFVVPVLKLSQTIRELLPEPELAVKPKGRPQLPEARPELEVAEAWESEEPLEVPAPPIPSGEVEAWAALAQKLAEGFPADTKPVNEAWIREVTNLAVTVKLAARWTEDALQAAIHARGHKHMSELSAAELKEMGAHLYKRVFEDYEASDA